MITPANRSPRWIWTLLAGFLQGPGADVSAFAVAGQFAVRNPEHELAAARLIAERTGRPVSASHQLSAKLGGPKRALTALLNARLIGMIDGLITRAETQMQQMGITAPMMVVRGDGALVSAAQARAAPIETILSGPAASIVGARWLTGATHALVSDIGGTTTDVAVLRDGQPGLDPQGARVGPYRTMVEAVAMRTTGLGGDSEVHFLSEGLAGGVHLGPRRVIPISLAATRAPGLVHAALDGQPCAPQPLRTRWAFLPRARQRRTPRIDRARRICSRGLARRSRPRLRSCAHGWSKAPSSGWLSAGLCKWRHSRPRMRLMLWAGPRRWDSEAACKALRLMGRRRTGAGMPLAPDPLDMARIITAQLTHQTGQALLEVAFVEESTAFGAPPEALAAHALMQHGLNDHRGLVRLSAG